MTTSQRTALIDSPDPLQDLFRLRLPRILQVVERVQRAGRGLCSQCPPMVAGSIGSSQSRRRRLRSRRSAWSGRPGSNRRPSAPKADTLPLRYAPRRRLSHSARMRIRSRPVGATTARVLTPHSIHGPDMSHRTPAADRAAAGSLVTLAGGTRSRPRRNSLSVRLRPHDDDLRVLLRECPGRRLLLFGVRPAGLLRISGADGPGFALNCSGCAAA